MVGMNRYVAGVSTVPMALLFMWRGGEWDHLSPSLQVPSARFGIGASADRDKWLIQAVRSNDTSSAIRALDAGANPNARDPFTLADGSSIVGAPPGPTALLFALRSPWDFDLGPVKDRIRLIKSLLLHGAKVDARDAQGLTALMWATCPQSAKSPPYKQIENVRSVRQLLADHADPNASDKAGRTPLIWAAAGGPLYERYGTVSASAMVKTLLARGARVNTRDKSGKTALMEAAARRDIRSVQALLRGDRRRWLFAAALLILPGSPSGVPARAAFTGPQMASLPQTPTVLYGTTMKGSYVDVEGLHTCGSVFRLNTDGSDFRVLRQLHYPDSGEPYARLLIAGNTLYGTEEGGEEGGLFQIGTDGSNFREFLPLSLQDCQRPYCSLLREGNTLYATAARGGPSYEGAVFRVNTDGTGLKILHYFITDPDGGFPQGGLVQQGDRLFGTTNYGGKSEVGSIFSVRKDGSDFRVLHMFEWDDGAKPYAAMLLIGNTLFGTTLDGGKSRRGVVFRMNTDGSGYHVLHDFRRNGGLPYGDLIHAGDVLYGTTSVGGGDSDGGMIFRLKTDGSDFRIVHAFTPNEGAHPHGGLLLLEGVLYGTATEGGHYDYGTVFRVNTDGSNFRVLHRFNSRDGAHPEGGLVAKEERP